MVQMLSPNNDEIFQGDNLPIHKGTRGVSWALPGSLCCQEVTLLTRDGSGYSPGVVEADHSLSLPKTICAW